MKNLDDLKSIISEPRLLSFQGDSTLEKLESYQSNIELSESLYPALHIFEISLRNKIHDLATSIWGEDWIYSQKVILSQYHQQKVIKAQKDLQRIDWISLESQYWLKSFSRHENYL